MVVTIKLSFLQGFTSVARKILTLQKYAYPQALLSLMETIREFSFRINSGVKVLSRKRIQTI